jgi:hypothetical protein
MICPICKGGVRSSMLRAMNGEAQENQKGSFQGSFEKLGFHGDSTADDLLGGAQNQFGFMRDSPRG